MKKLIALALCLLLFCSLAACQTEAKPAAVEPPIGGLTWGMTVDEVKTALVKSGLAEGEIVLNVPDGNGHTQILLGAEQCKTLKIDPVPDCPLRSNGIAVKLFFLKDTQGQAYLGYIYAAVTAEKQSDVAAQLTKLHGEPTGENFWEVDGRQVNISNGAFDTDFIVEYHANKYVKENFGNF